MKVKIKSVKGKGHFYLLWVSVLTPEEANQIAIKAKEFGATPGQIAAFIKKNEYNGVVSFDFNIICSEFTALRVAKNGILDIDSENVRFWVSDKGFLNAAIRVVNKREQINGYESPTEEVEGWNVAALEIQKPIEEAEPTIQPLNELVDITKIATETDLPF